MAAPEQLPTQTLAVGGQTAISGWDVLSESEGWEDDTVPYQNTNGTHKVDITYSRRKTFELELQAQFGTTAATLLAGGALTVATVACRIKTVRAARTRGPLMATLTAIAVADSVA